MGVKVVLQTIEGKKREEVLDPNYALAKVLPFGNTAFPLLQYVDPYGNVIFNRQQMDEVLRELDALIRETATDEQKEILLSVRSLAAQCKDSPHLFLRFRGD